MKKIFALLLCVAMLAVCFIGCAETTPDDGNKDNPADTTVGDDTTAGVF